MRVLTLTQSDLERRFFEAIGRQSTMLLPNADNATQTEVAALTHNHPYVETEYGTIWFHWLTEMPNRKWFDSVYDSRIITISVNSALLGDELTDEQLDFIARDGSYMIGDDVFQIYSRVF